MDGYVSSTDLSPRFSMKEGAHNILLFVNNQGCTDSIQKLISIYPEIKIFLPTAFTPNGDGQNDEFKPVFNYLPDSCKFLTFGHFGKLVFSSTNPKSGWNGKVNNTQEPKTGIYL